MNLRVLVRLALFRNSGYKMLLRGGETPNDDKHPDAFSSQHNNGGFTKPGGQSESDYLMNNHAQNLEGRALSALNSFGENARMVSEPAWLRRVQQQHAIMEPPSNHAYKIKLSDWLRWCVSFIEYVTKIIFCCYRISSSEANHFHHIVWKGSSWGFISSRGNAIYHKTTSLCFIYPEVWNQVMDSLVAFSDCGLRWDGYSFKSYRVGQS